MRFFPLALGVALSSMGAAMALATSTEPLIIPITALKAAPVLDGSAEDWKDVAGVEVPLSYLGKPELGKTVLLKAGTFGYQVFSIASGTTVPKTLYTSPMSGMKPNKNMLKGRSAKIALQ